MNWLVRGNARAIVAGAGAGVARLVVADCGGSVEF